LRHDALGEILRRASSLDARRRDEVVLHALRQDVAGEVLRRASSLDARTRVSRTQLKVERRFRLIL